MSTRREFITNTTAVAAGAAAFGLTGNASVAPAADDPQKDGKFGPNDATANKKLISIAILKARPNKRLELQAELLGLIKPTRSESGNLDYVLFELRDDPGTFYMREAFENQAALDLHFQAPYFQAFAAKADDLLADPLKLVFLNQISP